MNPYTILAGLLMLIAVYFGGQHQGKKIERAEWQKEKIALQGKALADIQVEVDKRNRAALFHQAIARKASEDYEKALNTQAETHLAEVAAIKRSGGLRIPATACRAQAAAGTEATGTSGPDEAGPATVELPQPTQQGLFDLVRRADELAEQLRGLQGWVRDNGFYGDGIPQP